MSKTPETLEVLVRRYYDARVAAKEAKRKMVNLASVVGQCEGIEDGEAACYEIRNNESAYCDVCKEKLPLWKKHRAAATAAGVALRSLLRRAKTLPEVKEPK